MSSKRIHQPTLIENLREISNSVPPPNGTDKLSAIPIIHELGTVYLILHNAIRDFPKLERYTLGMMIEKIHLECIESCFAATASSPEQKSHAVARASALFDTLKLYIRISVQVKCLQETRYIKMIPRLGEIGRMLGGWLQKTKSQNPNTKT